MPQNYTFFLIYFIDFQFFTKFLCKFLLTIQTQKKHLQTSVPQSGMIFINN